MPESCNIHGGGKAARKEDPGGNESR